MGLMDGMEDATPLGLCGDGTHTTQGSACGATLGYRTESRWDSQRNVDVVLFLFGIPKEMCVFSLSISVFEVGKYAGAFGSRRYCPEGVLGRNGTTWQCL